MTAATPPPPRDGAVCECLTCGCITDRCQCDCCCRVVWRLPAYTRPAAPAEEQQDDKLTEEQARHYGAGYVAGLAARPSADTETLRARMLALASELDAEAAERAESSWLVAAGEQSGLLMAVTRLRAALDAR